MTSSKSIGLMALIIAIVLSGTAWAAVPKTKGDHETLAAKYEKKAADQESVVKEHTEMKQEYHTKWLPKQERDKALSEMDTHCDAIISEAKKLADEYKAIAQWHKLRAQEITP